MTYKPLSTVVVSEDPDTIADVYVPTWEAGDRAYMMVKGRLPKNKTRIGSVSR